MEYLNFKPKAVIFDMDGVLIDSEPLWQESEMEAFSRVGLELTKEDCESTVGMRIDLVVEHWFSTRPWQGRSVEELADDIVEGVVKRVLASGKPKAGALGLIRQFHEKGIPLAIASSSYLRIIEAVVDHFGIRDFFQKYIPHNTKNSPSPIQQFT